MKQQIESLIDRLADKSLTFGCLCFDTLNQKVGRYHGGETEKEGIANCIILGHPIHLHDVLEKIENQFNENPTTFKGCPGHKAVSLLWVWQPLGFTKSVQEIYNECQWEQIHRDFPCDGICHPSHQIQVPLQQTHRDFFQFLLDLKL
jgi:hypothetical protein